MWKIYAVRTIYRTKALGNPKTTDKYYRRNLDMIEERIVLIKARSFDEAIKKGEKEAKKYASYESYINPYGQKVVEKYIGSIDVFEPFDEIAENKEIFSSTHIVPSTWGNKIITDRIFGTVNKNERHLRKKFLNKEFSGIVKKNC